MADLCDLQIHVNGQQTFFVNEKILSRYCGSLKKVIEIENGRSRIKNSKGPVIIDIDDFPGGAEGFELVSRFCYDNGRTAVTVSNVSLLYCCAVFLGMTETVSSCNLLQQTEIFLDGSFYWSWIDIVVSLKSCESFFSFADSSGLLEKLIFALLAKFAQNSDAILAAAPSSSSSSSPETATTSGFRISSSTKAAPPSARRRSSAKAWWFDDLSILPPKIIEKVVKSLGAYGAKNNSLILTKFLLHYLQKSGRHRNSSSHSRSEYGGLADTVAYGAILLGKTAFSWRGLFWILRVVSGMGLSRECRVGLERLIGGMLDEATLDDLLVCGHDGGVYDVNLVLRLIRLFVISSDDNHTVSVQKMKKVGRLIDKYLGEVSPDQNLKVSKFLGVAESLPDSARDCFDGVYRAIDIYLQSHPTVSFEESSRLCRCLNYEKLTLEACKDLAKNPKIPPKVAVQALASQSQQCNIARTPEFVIESPIKSHAQLVMYNSSDAADSASSEENEDLRLNLQRMQWRVVELEKVCREMKGQMSRMAKSKVSTPSPGHNIRAMPRLC